MMDVLSAKFLESARLLVPRLIERGARADGERRIPDETIAEMKAAGLFRALQPKRWGGYELDLRAFYDTLMTLAEGDMSTAWVYGVLGVAPWVVALLDDRAAADVWAEDSSVLIGLSLAPAGEVTPVEGGVRISGRWRFASGSAHCDWAFLGAIVGAPATQGAPPRAGWHVLLVPKADYRIDDTWYTFGLKGTGSNDIVVTDAFVPEHRMRSMADNVACTGPGQAVNTGPLYRLPFGQVFGGGVAYGPIGGLHGMLDEFLAYAQERVRSGGRTTVADPDARLVVAEAENAIDELTTIAHRNAGNLTAYAERGEVPPAHERLKYKFQMATASERCRASAARIVQAAGASGIATQYRFGRTLADLTSARQHITNQHEMHARHWGAHLFGETPAPDLMQ
jgi:3-hydroxy-9,10-secoandrosta-1,3,5(10)-triene-9,17-dione monooxygenase